MIKKLMGILLPKKRVESVEVEEVTEPELSATQEIQPADMDFRCVYLVNCDTIEGARAGNRDDFMYVVELVKLGTTTIRGFISRLQEALDTSRPTGFRKILELRECLSVPELMAILRSMKVVKDSLDPAGQNRRVLYIGYGVDPQARPKFTVVIESGMVANTRLIKRHVDEHLLSLCTEDKLRLLRSVGIEADDDAFTEVNGVRKVKSRLRLTGREGYDISVIDNRNDGRRVYESSTIASEPEPQEPDTEVQEESSTDARRSGRKLDV